MDVIVCTRPVGNNKGGPESNRCFQQCQAGVMPLDHLLRLFLVSLHFNCTCLTLMKENRIQRYIFIFIKK